MFTGQYLLDSCMDERFWGGRNWMGFGPLSLIFWILIILAVVILFIFIINPKKAKSIFKKGTYEHDPYEILKTRYAKGEISKEEYEKIKKDLDNNYLNK